MFQPFTLDTVIISKQIVQVTIKHYISFKKPNKHYTSSSIKGYRSCYSANIYQHSAIEATTTCNATSSCRFAEIYGEDSQSIIINCSDWYACASADIYSPITENSLDLNCADAGYSCGSITVYASDSLFDPYFIDLDCPPVITDEDDDCTESE